MNFSCNKKAFSEAVSTIQRAVATKSTVPALEGILITTQGNAIMLTAYDLEIGMTTQVDADISEPGGVIVNAKIFAEILKKLPVEKVTVLADKKQQVIISSGASEFTILGINASEFPNLPTVDESTKITLPQPLLASMIRQTIYCISTDDAKPIHTGSLFELSNGQIRIVSVDGFRIAIRTEQIKNELEIKFVIPGKTLGEILKLLSDGDISLGIGRRHILFTIGRYTIVSRLLEGEFMDYTAVIGTKPDREVKAKVRSFADSVERASLIISERLKSPVKCKFDTDLIAIACSTAVGKVNDKIPATLKGKPLEMGFNNRYLLDALHAADCDEVRLFLDGELSPMKIYPADGEGFIFLVLPVRLKKE
jgi:DNA polymerase III subunit beta